MEDPENRVPYVTRGLVDEKGMPQDSPTLTWKSPQEGAAGFASTFAQLRTQVKEFLILDLPGILLPPLTQP